VAPFDEKKTTKEYVASLSPEERREIARSLLSETRLGDPDTQYQNVSQRSVWFSRVISTLLVAYYIYVLGVPVSDHFQTLVGVAVITLVVWFPNQASRLTGRFGIATVIRRVSPPRMVLLFAWILLLMPILAKLLYAAP